MPDVSEVASIGGMVQQYQVVLDPDKLRAYGITQAEVASALGNANQASGGSVVELAESEYMVRSTGYLRTLDDFRHVVLRTNDAGTPVLLGDVARIQVGPAMRRGIAELNGQGEVTGGVVVMRSGKNALTTIDAVKAKLADLKRSLPPGVEIVTTYDRSQLIARAVGNLKDKLIEEFVIVGIVCAVFLFHLRSAFVAILSLPLGVLAAFIVMRYQREREPDVARRDRDRDRRDDRRGDRDDRERAQASRSVRPRASRRADHGRATLGTRRGVGRGVSRSPHCSSRC